MAKIGLAGHEWTTYGNNLLAHVVVTFIAYLLFGGWRLFSSHKAGDGAALAPHEPFETKHWLTLGVLAAVVLGVILFEFQVGMAALTGATFLSLVKAGDEKEAIKRMPWGVVLMVCGVTVLIGVLEKTQGMSLFTDILASVSSPATVTAVVAFATGIVSVYSSTSGVVLPAFLPTVPGLVERLGGGDPMAIASSMVVGGHLVDLSPLSTIGALCIAALPGHNSEESRRLFSQLLAWGMSMTVVGTLACWLLF
jgi:Na+/H+ antiporter NhaD/arsenite permease-like protein